MRKILFTLVFLAFATVAQAQSIANYTLTIWNGTTIVSTTVILAANFVCGSAPLSGTAINPRHIMFTDPANTAMVCLFTDNGTTGPISSLPFGNTTYTATLIATNTAGLSSPPSANSNSFTVPGVPPGALTGVRVVQ